MNSLHINLIIGIILVLIISFLLFTRCFYKENDVVTKENMTNLTPSLIGFNMSDGVPGDIWSNSRTESLNSQNDENFFSQLADIQAGQVVLPDDQLNFFYKNHFDAKCCFKPQNYSSSSGCACISEEQMRFLNERGGNNNI